MQRTSEAGLVKTAPEQELVYGLQLAQCESRRQQAEGDGLLIDPGPHGDDRRLETGGLSSGKRRHVRSRDPHTMMARTRRAGHKAEVGHYDIVSVTPVA